MLLSRPIASVPVFCEDFPPDHLLSMSSHPRQPHHTLASATNHAYSLIAFIYLLLQIYTVSDCLDVDLLGNIVSAVRSLKITSIIHDHFQLPLTVSTVELHLHPRLAICKNLSSSSQQNLVVGILDDTPIDYSQVPQTISTGSFSSRPIPLFTRSSKVFSLVTARYRFRYP